MAPTLPQVMKVAALLFDSEEITEAAFAVFSSLVYKMVQLPELESLKTTIEVIFNAVEEFSTGLPDSRAPDKQWQVKLHLIKEKDTGCLITRRDDVVQVDHILPRVVSRGLGAIYGLLSRSSTEKGFSRLCSKPPSGQDLIA